MGKKQVTPQAANPDRTATVMLRLPYSLHVRLVAHARQKTVPPAVLARMLVLEGLDQLDRQKGASDVHQP